MRKRTMRRLVVWLILGLATVVPLGQVTSQLGPNDLIQCENFAFSTEVDFVAQAIPPDNNPIISDGDLLGADCTVCARNTTLLQPFDVTVDLGLDAVDILTDTETILVIFSTELDSPNVGQFTSGDLLNNNGGVIPNIALTYGFAVGYDLGLDAVHLVGEPRNISAFLDEAQQYSRADWLAAPETLAPMLNQHGIDIWFSTEGTAPPVATPAFLDGDLLSARDGVIVARNADLLPAGVPAGIPTDGVDFGLDAASSNRAGERPRIDFSTEILYADTLSFTDGDILKYNGFTVYSNQDLVQCFGPQANFLGLDAFYSDVADVYKYIYLPLVLRDYF